MIFIAIKGWGYLLKQITDNLYKVSINRYGIMVLKPCRISRISKPLKLDPDTTFYWPDIVVLDFSNGLKCAEVEHLFAFLSLLKALDYQKK